mmetsp:Transcript_11224/g.32275  ORF Transcript_11224/g.32275 Transcript_11224/m.32275 type:complete len:218 (+) Transcript_11224:1124-1777(+)
MHTAGGWRRGQGTSGLGGGGGAAPWRMSEVLRSRITAMEPPDAVHMGFDDPVGMAVLENVDQMALATAIWRSVSAQNLVRTGVSRGKFSQPSRRMHQDQVLRKQLEIVHVDVVDLLALGGSLAMESMHDLEESAEMRRLGLVVLANRGWNRQTTRVMNGRCVRGPPKSPAKDELIWRDVAYATAQERSHIVCEDHVLKVTCPMCELSMVDVGQLDLR